MEASSGWRISEAERDKSLFCSPRPPAKETKVSVSISQCPVSVSSFGFLKLLTFFLNAFELCETGPCLSPREVCCRRRLRQEKEGKYANGEEVKKSPQRWRRAEIPFPRLIFSEEKRIPSSPSSAFSQTSRDGRTTFTVCTVSLSASFTLFKLHSLEDFRFLRKFRDLALV